MRSFMLSVIAVLGLLTVPIVGYGLEPSDVVVKNPSGRINWTKGVVTAIGIGTISDRTDHSGNGRQAALANAYSAAKRNMLRIIETVNIDSNRTIGDLLSKNEAIRTKLTAIVDTLQESPPTASLPGGAVQVRLELSMLGEFAALVLPPEITIIKPIKPVGGSKYTAVSTDTKPNDKDSGNPIHQKSEIHTGMIVDAKGLSEVRPAMVHQIVDETGKEIYGPAYVSREYAVASGMCTYLKSMSAARSAKRVKQNPLIVKGLKTRNLGRLVIVVSNADALKLRHESEHLAFLKQGRVVILLD